MSEAKDTKPKGVKALPMNAIGESPWHETYMAWRFGVDPAEARDVMAALVKRIPGYMDEFLARCESPIERLFVVGLELVGGANGVNVHPGSDIVCPWIEAIYEQRDPEQGADEEPRISICVAVEAQAQCTDDDGKPTTPRLDFLLTTNDGDIQLNVELDGHEFHERTKEQAQADRARDRKMLALGIPTVRFTGSEVHADPAKCAREALSLIAAMSGRFDSEAQHNWSSGWTAGKHSLLKLANVMAEEAEPLALPAPEAAE